MMKALESVLLVDDDKITNMYNKMVIEKMNIGVSVATCANGQEALDYLTCTGEYSDRDQYPSPNLILLDINMPGLNGWDFLEEYKKLPEEVKAEVIIVMLTTSLNPDDEQKANNYNEISHYAHKPLVGNVLKDLIETHWPKSLEASSR